MECVQLAAAFSGASLLAAGLFHGRPARERGLAKMAKAPEAEASFRPRKAAASCTHFKASLRTPGGMPITSVSRTP